MKHKKIIGYTFFLAVAIMLLSSCAQKMICPAYQSAFIYDTAALRKKFSYFVNDTPKIIEVSKNKFLLIEPMSYRKKMASFRTIEMLPIYPVIPDSLKFQGDEQMRAEMDIQDSTATPAGEALHPGLIGPKFNVEQENYMYYFRKVLVLPDVRAERGTMAAPKKKKKLFGFMSKIFKRDKNEEQAQTTDASVAPEEQPAEEKQPFFKRIFKKKEAPPETDPENEEDNSNEGDTGPGNGN